ncbi:MAG: class II aldolase/adducin family protein [Dehalococcoidia bacterium]
MTATRDSAVLTAREAVLECARTIVATGTVSRSGHGNISARIPGTDRIVLTAVGAITALRLDDLALLTLDGTVLEGRLDPANAEIVHMHTETYRRRPDVGGVVHTHAPYVTAYAVANRAIECIYEGMARFDMADPVPVAAYAPRGSDESVGNIVQAITDRAKAVLLQNHGILTFAADPVAAARVLTILEEAAELGIYAAALGTPTTISAHMAAYAQRRAAEFAARG